MESVDVAVWCDQGRWHFRYLVEGAQGLALPDPAAPARADGLWKTTCFEAFAGLSGGAYLEFNFSPSSQWAAYRFDAYRQGMREEPTEVEVWSEGGDSWIALEASVRCDALVARAPLGLTAVIEEKGAQKSYWALAHPANPSKALPDFHDRSCFVAKLADIAAS
ncbi:MAG: DOMON-like domain-containing protein [Sphingomonas sp.]|nr:DOMON-like domain-containing protein [Sphingomonas sp.]